MNLVPRSEAFVVASGNELIEADGQGGRVAGARAKVIQQRLDVAMVLTNFDASTPHAYTK